MKSNVRIFPTVYMILLLAGTQAAAEDSSTASGISVSAGGETNVKPNKLEIEVKTSVSAELTGDAVVKYRDALRRAKDIVEKLKIDNLHVVDEGVVVSSSGVSGGNTGMGVPVNAFVAGGGNGNNSVKQEVSISKSWKLAVGGIDKLSEDEVIALVAKLLDVVKDAGLMTNSSPNANGETEPDGQPVANPLVQFVADDVSAAQKTATDQAFQHAKEKAQHIAELTGGQLGPATSVEESTSMDSSDASSSPYVQSYYANGNFYTTTSNSAGASPRASAYALADLPVRVNLRVRFALQPNSQTVGGSK